MNQKNRRRNTSGLKQKRKKEIKIGKDIWTAKN
jgi:hypothetical protein